MVRVGLLLILAVGCESVYRGYDFLKPAFEGKGGYVRVAEGDTVYGLSQKLKVPMRSFIIANGLKPPYKLVKGAKLVVPKRLTYTIKKGDTLYGIARIHSVDFKHLASFNGLNNPSFIRAGQVLYLPDDIILPSSPASSPRAFGQSTGVGEPAKKAEQKASAPSKKKTLSQKPKKPVTKKPNKPKKPVAIGKGNFQWPIRGKLLSSYGSKGGGLYNDGINIQAKRGSKVASIQAGEVVYAGNELRGYGNLVLVKHRGGWVSAYAHNQALKVEQGTRVARGETIALVGHSGNVENAQLHFELRLNGKSVNPIKYLPRG